MGQNQNNGFDIFRVAGKFIEGFLLTYFFAAVFVIVMLLVVIPAFSG